MAIPLYSFDSELLDFIGRREALRLERDKQARIVRQRKGEIARVILHRRCCDPRRPVQIRDYQGQAYSLLQPLENNLECWRFRPLQGGRSETTLAPEELRPVFLQVVLECLA